MRRPGGSVGGPGGEPGPQATADRKAGAITLRLTPDRASRLREIAAERGLPVSAVVSEWVDACGPADPDEG